MLTSLTLAALISAAPSDNTSLQLTTMEPSILEATMTLAPGPQPTVTPILVSSPGPEPTAEPDYTPIDYTPGAIEAALENGDTVVVIYGADWCSTCARQERVMKELRETGAYEDLTFIRVDWDTYGREAVTTDRGIPRRSTLVMLRGEEEIDRLVAVTGTQAITNFLDQGL